MTRVRQGDRLLLLVVSTVAGVIRASARVVLKDGSEKELRIPDTVLTGAVGVPAAQEPQSENSPDAGLVADAIVSITPAVAVSRGQIYASLYLSDGSERKNTLCKGYVYNGHDLAEGQFVEPGPSGGVGAIRSISLGDPAANAEYAVQAVPVNTVWKLRGFSGALVTDATAANRSVALVVNDGTNVVVAGVSEGHQAASKTITYHGGLGVTSQANSNLTDLTNQGIGLPDILMPEAYEFTSAVRNRQVTDNWGAGWLLVEEWVIP